MTDIYKVGRVFTPLSWAIWLIEISGAFQAWLDGATVLDPTCGEGAFLEAFVALARRRGILVTQDSLARLYGVEIVESDKSRLLERIKRRHDAILPDGNIKITDFITASLAQRYDVLVGNPPWINFTDLPGKLKDKWGPAYLKLQLVKNKKDVLLGGSRTDVAALVLKKALEEMLHDNGRAAFFIPLSLFFNSGANDQFRPFPGSRHKYRVVKLWDFAKEAVFEGISTRYGAVLFDRQGPQMWPVETNVRDSGGWNRLHSAPGDYRSAAWQRRETPEIIGSSLPTIEIRPSQKPRQGVNTCGANNIFIFERNGDRLCNGFGEELDLEEELLFPLMNASSFGRPFNARQRWILIPHHTQTGRPFEWEIIAKYKYICAYLSKHQELLKRRKGTLIESQIGRGFWWCLLGVGPYSFASWKVAWEALGRKNFTPAVLEGRWQGNQAMHAFCPCASAEEAEMLASALRRTEVERWLKSSSMEGTCSWAQPGRIAQVLAMRERRNDRFS